MKRRKGNSNSSFYILHLKDFSLKYTFPPNTVITKDTDLKDILQLESPMEYSELLMLAYFAVFDTSLSSMQDIKQCLKDVSRKFKPDDAESTLKKHSLIKPSLYSFVHHDMIYKISSDVMVKVLIWLFETKDGHRILDVLQRVMSSYKTPQTQIQVTLCKFIQSKYKATDVAKKVFANDAEFILPVITEERFHDFIISVTEVAFIELMDTFFIQAYNASANHCASTILHIISSYKFSSDKKYLALKAKADLYAFLAEGIVPEKMEGKNTIEGMMLMALMEAYNGKYDEAIKIFRQVLIAYNNNLNHALSNNILPYNICNFFHILCCKKDGSEASMRIIQNYFRRNENNKSEEIRPAWLLTTILLNKPGFLQEIRSTYESQQGLAKEMMVLLAMYTGKTNILPSEAYTNDAPTWLALKNEYDKYVPMTEEEKAKATAAYHGNTLLSSIHTKQQWELVLESLSQNGGNTAPMMEQTERYAYFIRNIYDESCEIRQQSILKSGAWSAGKSVSLSYFISNDSPLLSMEDRRIRQACRADAIFNHNYIKLSYVLPEMVNQSRLYVGKNAPYSIVTVNEEMPYLVIESTGVGFDIKSNVPVDDIEKDIIIISRGAASINFLRMKPELRPYFSQLLDLGSFPLEAEEVLKKFLESLRGKVEVHSELIEGGSTLEKIKGTSAITLQMRPQGKDAYVVSIFCRPVEGGRTQCIPGEGSNVIMDVKNGIRVAVERNLDRERELYFDLVNGVEDILPPEKSFQIDAYDLLPIIDFIRSANEKLTNEHNSQENSELSQPDLYQIEWPEGHKLNIRTPFSTSSWSATVKKNENGWFEIEGSVEIDENTRLSIAQLLELIGQSKNRFIRLGDSDFVALSDKLRKQLNALEVIAAHSHGKLQISPFSAALIDSSILYGEMKLNVDPELKEIRQRIIDSSEYKPDIPDTLKATLREYQKEGFQWIARLNSWGAGALLADDMGLGKTVQTIAYLLFKAKEGPALVVAPASVAPNWKTEFEKFAPSLNVEILNFSQNRSLCIADAKAGDVIITTYGLLLSVKDEITSKQWTTAVLDEAHVIKNRGAKTSGVAMQLKTKYRIMLTGTPVQNHLGELWNLFQFVNPGLLGSYDDFSRRFILPIETAGDKARQKDLDRLVHPFMLRRTKEKVLAELPEKTEIYQTVDLSDEEMAVYEIIREKAEQMLESEGSEKVSINTLAEITRLRQAACSAALVEKQWKGKTSKVEALLEALEPIVESGDSVLVFSQFTSFLSIVKKALDKAKVPYLYIDGSVSVKERQKLVEQFQEGKCPVFVISLKAGGLGLNLTRANYVFHLDPWWNPAIEQQATDRAYRIGQHNAVTVYHFLSAGTIEEKIKRLHDRKRDLAENVLDGTDMSGKITGRQLLEMIR